MAALLVTTLEVTNSASTTALVNPLRTLGQNFKEQITKIVPIWRGSIYFSSRNLLSASSSLTSSK